MAVSIRDRIKHEALAPLPLPLKRKFRLAITQLFTLRSAALVEKVASGYFIKFSRFSAEFSYDISTEKDSFYCYPLREKKIVTKLAFATEEIYKLALEKREK